MLPFIMLFSLLSLALSLALHVTHSGVLIGLGSIFGVSCLVQIVRLSSRDIDAIVNSVLGPEFE